MAARTHGLTRPTLLTPLKFVSKFVRISEPSRWERRDRRQRSPRRPSDSGKERVSNSCLAFRVGDSPARKSGDFPLQTETPAHGSVVASNAEPEFEFFQFRKISHPVQSQSRSTMKTRIPFLNTHLMKRSLKLLALLASASSLR